MNEQKKPKSENTPLYKVTTVIGIVLCVILVPILIINCTLIVKGLINDKEAPDFFGYVPFIVYSDSMSPVFEENDLIIVKEIDPADVKTGEKGTWSDAGDIISFYDPASKSDPKAVLTHRAMYKIENSDGTYSFKTAGDFNVSKSGYDGAKETDYDTKAVPAEDVIGVYTGIRIPVVGGIALKIKEPMGIVLCVGIPLVLLIGYDILRRKLYEKKKDTENKDIDALMAELEALKAAKAAEEAKTASPAETVEPVNTVETVETIEKVETVETVETTETAETPPDSNE